MNSKVQMFLTAQYYYGQIVGCILPLLVGAVYLEYYAIAAIGFLVALLVMNMRKANCYRCHAFIIETIIDSILSNKFDEDGVMILEVGKDERPDSKEE
jgi:hypothetical protein